MRKRSRFLAFTTTSLLLAALLSACITGTAASEDDTISYTVDDDSVTLLTDEMSIAISTLFPAAAIKETDSAHDSAYGFVFSSILGYNESAEGLLLDEVPYHASMEHATWTSETPVIVDEGDGSSTAHVSMHSTVNMNKRIAFEDGNPNPGSPGIEIIEDWATVTVEFIISSANFSSTFDGQIDESLYPVNGSTELKFDITIDINIPIDADHLALDIGLMMMDFGNFTPTSMDEQYVFEGYQAAEVSISDPDVNETIDDELIMHTFQHRDDFKQLFTFVETREMSFFSWASDCMLHAVEEGDSFEELTTYFRTDGEALKVYISSPVTPETASVTHDPSLGLFPSPGNGGVIDLPDGDLIGSSAMSTVAGIIIGLAVAGGAGLAIAARRSASQDQSDTVVLEKNRYYKGK